MRKYKKVSSIFKWVMVSLFLTPITALIWYLSPGVIDSWSSESKQLSSGIGDVTTLLAKYDRWKKSVDDGDENNLILELRYTQGMSSEFTQARGDARFNLVKGTGTINAHGLPKEQAHDVWLVDNHSIPGNTIKPEPGDSMIKLGTLDPTGETATLQASLEQGLFEGFKIDLVVITAKGKNPIEGGLLFGSPNLFQKIYFGEQNYQSVNASAVTVQQEPNKHLSAVFRALLPAPAFAKDIGTGEPLYPSMTQLIDKGEDIFFNEEFNGNGRTCGTCHPAENNFTIDPAFIATLPQSDALFVAEHNPRLEGLEKPALMRNTGLILENLDGFDEAGVLRATPHLLGLSLSLSPDDGSGFVHATGWSGDGAPSPGGLRDFATGAVMQHFTKTLTRAKGTDFRQPTEVELDALEAFQLALGRPADEDLSTLELKNKIARFGQKIFLCSQNSQPLTCPDDEFGTVVSGRCNVCHENAGANFSLDPGVNANFDTGVERMTGQPGRLLDPSIPCDAGFGDSPAAVDDETAGSPCKDIADGFGDGTFNTPPLIEAADTAPFFHNHSVKTLEGAIAFYNGANFNNSPGAQVIGITGFVNAIGLDEPEVDAVAAFLRVLNALENIRNAIRMEQNAIDAMRIHRRRANVDRLLLACLEDTKDALKVLKSADLHYDAVASLKKAKKHLAKALKSHSRRKRIRELQHAMHQQLNARGYMCSSPNDLLCKKI